MGILGSPNHAPSEARLHEPLVQEAIQTCGISNWQINRSMNDVTDLVKRYLENGWMRI